jgi:hypothetical protein
MKTVTKVSMVLWAALTLCYGANASAGSVCYIYLTKPCLVTHNPYFAPGRHFVDPDGIANVSAARCIERAREYKAWCRTPGIEASSIFQVNGLNQIAATTSSDGKSYISNGLGRWTNFKD